MSPKMGRPTNDPKRLRITVRINEEQRAILDKYSEENKVNDAEALRKAIHLLKNHLNKA